MPRQPRLVLSAVPLHIIQRGHDRQRCFFSNDDFELYRSCLHEQAVQARCAVHAYVLMSNHVHLLASVPDTAGLALMMKGVAQRYAQYFNHHYRHTGAVWEGRYRSCLVQEEDYLLRCQRYIELNPVRAAMVRFPGNYRWSSYRSNAEGRYDAIVTPHAVYQRLGRTALERSEGYLRLFQEVLTPMQIEQLRQSAHGAGALGDQLFIEKHRKPTPQP